MPLPVGPGRVGAIGALPASGFVDRPDLACPGAEQSLVPVRPRDLEIVHVTSGCGL
jgi:hypothetical protein